MREIKFRAWDGSEMTPIFSLREAMEDEVYTTHYEELILMQYTGLKDKNGVEIYEGDISSDGYVMSYDWGCFRFRKGESVKQYNPYRYGDVLDKRKNRMDVEVIGNIYENSELLNKEVS